MSSPASSPKPREHSIEMTLRKKDEDYTSHANEALERDFREKYAKQNQIVEKNFDLQRTEFVIDRMFLHTFLIYSLNSYFYPLSSLFYYSRRTLYLSLHNICYSLDYACAHYGKIPKQGRLYITPKFVLFFANILGKKVKVCWSFIIGSVLIVYLTEKDCLWYNCWNQEGCEYFVLCVPHWDSVEI